MSDKSAVVIANNALAQGYCNACQEILDISIEDFLEDEQVRS